MLSFGLLSKIVAWPDLQRFSEQSIRETLPQILFKCINHKRRVLQAILGAGLQVSKHVNLGSVKM